MAEKKQSSDGTYVVETSKKGSILAFIGCFILAFIIWTYVMNVQISDNTKTITVRMDIKGESALLNDKNYSVFGASETWVKLTVQGSNADLHKYSESDFDVYVDVSSVEKTGVTPLNIVVETPSTSLTVLSVDPVQTTVFIDEKINNKEVKLVAELSEELIGSDTKIELASNTLGVGGPRTYVDKISYAKIIIDAVKLDESALDNSQKTEYKVFFYDDADNIVQSPYIVFNSSDIEVSFADTNSETSAAQTEAQSEQSAQ